MGAGGMASMKAKFALPNFRLKTTPTTLDEMISQASLTGDGDSPPYSPNPSEMERPAHRDDLIMDLRNACAVLVALTNPPEPDEEDQLEQQRQLLRHYEAECRKKEERQAQAEHTEQLCQARKPTKHHHHHHRRHKSHRSSHSHHQHHRAESEGQQSVYLPLQSNATFAAVPILRSDAHPETAHPETVLSTPSHTATTVCDMPEEFQVSPTYSHGRRFAQAAEPTTTGNDDDDGDVSAEMRPNLASETVFPSIHGPLFDHDDVFAHSRSPSKDTQPQPTQQHPEYTQPRQHTEQQVLDDIRSSMHLRPKTSAAACIDYGASATATAGSSRSISPTTSDFVGRPAATASTGMTSVQAWTPSAGGCGSRTENHHHHHHHHHHERSTSKGPSMAESMKEIQDLARQRANEYVANKERLNSTRPASRLSKLSRMTSCSELDERGRPVSRGSSLASSLASGVGNYLRRSRASQSRTSLRSGCGVDDDDDSSSYHRGRSGRSSVLSFSRSLSRGSSTMSRGSGWLRRSGSCRQRSRRDRDRDDNDNNGGPNLNRPLPALPGLDQYKEVKTHIGQMVKNAGRKTKAKKMKIGEPQPYLPPETSYTAALALSTSPGGTKQGEHVPVADETYQHATGTVGSRRNATTTRTRDASASSRMERRSTHPEYDGTNILTVFSSSASTVPQPPGTSSTTTLTPKKPTSTRPSSSHKSPTSPTPKKSFRASSLKPNRVRPGSATTTSLTVDTSDNERNLLRLPPPIIRGPSFSKELEMGSFPRPMEVYGSLNKDVQSPLSSTCYPSPNTIATTNYSSPTTHATTTAATTAPSTAPLDTCEAHFPFPPSALDFAPTHPDSQAYAAYTEPVSPRYTDKSKWRTPSDNVVHDEATGEILLFPAHALGIVSGNDNNTAAHAGHDATTTRDGSDASATQQQWPLDSCPVFALTQKKSGSASSKKSRNDSRATHNGSHSSRGGLDGTTTTTTSTATTFLSRKRSNSTLPKKARKSASEWDLHRVQQLHAARQQQQSQGGLAVMAKSSSGGEAAGITTTTTTSTAAAGAGVSSPLKQSLSATTPATENSLTPKPSPTKETSGGRFRFLSSSKDKDRKKDAPKEKEGKGPSLSVAAPSLSHSASTSSKLRKSRAPAAVVHAHEQTQRRAVAAAV